MMLTAITALCVGIILARSSLPALLTRAYQRRVTLSPRDRCGLLKSNTTASGSSAGGSLTACACSAAAATTPAAHAVGAFFSDRYARMGSSVPGRAMTGLGVPICTALGGVAAWQIVAYGQHSAPVVGFLSGNSSSTMPNIDLFTKVWKRGFCRGPERCVPVIFERGIGKGKSSKA
jgi:hypothetical protein